MANDQHIKIRISTTADTRGTDAAAAGIGKLTTAEEALNAKRAQFLTAAEAEVAEVERMAAAARKLSAAKEEEAASLAATTAALRREQDAMDVAEAKRRVAARGVTASAANMQNFGMVVNQVGYQVTDFAIQTQMGTSAITAFAQQAPQAIGAITQFGQGMKFSWGATVGAGTALGIFATVAAVGLQQVMAAWDAMDKEINKAEQSVKRFERQVRVMAEEQAKLYQAVRFEFITDVYREGAEFLERQVAALQRVNELRAAQGGAEAAQAAAAVTIAQNTGGNVLGARADAAAVGANNTADEMIGRLAAAEVVTAKAVQDLERANALAAEFRNIGDEFSDEAKASRADVVKAENALAAAELDLEKQRGLFEFARQTLEAGTAAEMNTLVTEAQASATKSAEETRAAIEQKIIEAGGNVSSSLKEAFAGLNKILADDGKVTENEMVIFVDAWNRARIANESKDTRILEGLDKMATATETILNRLPATETRIDAIMGRLEQLEAYSR
jgi:hypothetical protein